MTSAKFGALVMSALVLMYLVLVADRSFALVGSGEPIGIAIGCLMLFLPGVAFWGIFMELRFGLRIEKLGDQLKKENAWPQFPFELRPKFSNSFVKVSKRIRPIGKLGLLLVWHMMLRGIGQEPGRP